MVKTRNKDYKAIDPDDQGENTSTSNPIPTSTVSPIHTTSSTIRTPSDSTVLDETMSTDSSDLPEWKTINFRSKIMAIVRASGDPLKKDGSNYRDWDFRIRDLIDDWMEPGWLDRENVHIVNLQGDRIISKAPSAADAMKTIKALFYFPSRSKQVACLHDTLAVRWEDDDDVDKSLQAITDGFDELEQDGFAFTKDSLIAICFELAMPAKYSDVTSTLNSVLRAKPTEPISANQVEELIRLQRAPTYRNDNSSTPIDKCRGCGKEGHWAWACPLNPRVINSAKRTDQTWRRPQNQGDARASTSAAGQADNRFKVNFVDVNGTTFEADIDGPMPEGIWTSEGSLDVGGNEDDIGDTGASHNVTGDQLKRRPLTSQDVDH
ncbi:hypothetical protein CROQUDRAFT_664671 [Cronartium quercuum f. sp. fusiforme G11]|uniref:CCHC-type domain-containing protein n=1 Tax=Cronartium quercuum f. sp. fusiforme G11 TaxID=708437 RepID=A0A9P6T6V2_9BASI|nr:hypothetical protein CROQUDRAFT_664671 [Cronartium quercuum f. sp. fusiforme G11]